MSVVGVGRIVDGVGMVGVALVGHDVLVMDVDRIVAMVSNEVGKMEDDASKQVEGREVRKA